MPFCMVTAVLKPQAGECKIAASRARSVAIGIGEMRRTPAELALDPVGASRHLLARPLGAQLGDGIMPLGVRPDRDERIGGQDPERVQFMMRARHSAAMSIS